MKTGQCNFTNNLEFFKWESEEDTTDLYNWLVQREQYDGQIKGHKAKTAGNANTIDFVKIGGTIYWLGHPRYFTYQPSRYFPFDMWGIEEFANLFSETSDYEEMPTN